METEKKENNNAVRGHSIIIEARSKKTEYWLTIKDLEKVLPLLGKYSAILHDKDIILEGEEKGKLKRPHYHIVLNAYDKIRKSTLLNKLSHMLKIDKETITIDRLNDKNALLRYLLHLDNPEKHLYPPFEIFTNEPEAVQLAMDYMPNTITPESIMAIVYSVKGNKFLLMKQIGIDNYCRYERAIKVIIDEYYSTREN
ncbi:MAG: Rep family protein [Sulfolobaceae archaeon]